MNPKIPTDPKELKDLQMKNNPRQEPTGAFTGRCKVCHSKNLWDDN